MKKAHREENSLKRIFGTLKFSKPTAQLMREMDRELYPEPTKHRKKSKGIRRIRAVIAT